MKTNLRNLHNNRLSEQNMHRLRASEFSEKRHNNKQNNNVIRPAQAISFGGSAISLTEKFVESSPVNKLIDFVDKNEVAYTAIYSLLVAGILKPMAIIAQTGDDDKDGQIIATKNFLQAFIGTFLGLTIGGGFVKKIWNNLENHLKLFDIDKDDNLKTLSENSSKAKEISEELIKKEHNRIPDKLKEAKKLFSENTGLKRISGFFNGLFREINYKPDEDEIAAKSKELISNFNNNHKQIFEKNPKFLKELVKNMKEVESNPISAQANLGKGNKSQLSEAFASFWKNSSNVMTVVAKAKISSFLLPSVMAFFFAKKNAEAEMKKQGTGKTSENPSTLVNSKAFKETEGKFGAFKTENNKNIAFTGLLDTMLDKSVQLFEKAAMSKPGEAIVQGMHKVAKKPSPRMGDIESFGLTAYWVGSTAMSKKIETDQKLGLCVHSVLVSLISSAAALLIDTITDPIVNKAKNTYLDDLQKTAKLAKTELQKGSDSKQIEKVVVENTSKLFNAQKLKTILTDPKTLNLDPKKLNSGLENIAAKYGKKLSKLKSLTIFTLVVRFLVPVLTVNLSKKVKKKLIQWSENLRPDKKSENQKQETPKNTEKK